jgi:hypothetical protein
LNSVRPFLFSVVLALVASGTVHGAIRVDTTAEARAAIERIGNRAGTVVLESGRYEKLIIGPRSMGARWLSIVAEPGALTKHVVVARAYRVRLVNLRVTNYWGGDALVDVRRSSQVKIVGATVVGKPGRVARVRVWVSRQVTVRGSDFSRCGERVVCLGTPASDEVGVGSNTFHDCFGCDFFHVWRVDDLVLRGNTFDRALPSACGTHLHCNHQDLVQIIGGRRMLIEHNRFGMSAYGAAQVYISGQWETSDLTIRSNLFTRTDPAVPGRDVDTGLIVGNPSGANIPTNVVIAGNTFLSGTPRLAQAHWNGVANSIILTERYASYPLEDRPLLVNNVIRGMSHPELVCPLARASGHNALPTACTDLDLAGDPMVDEAGFPLEGSPLIGRAEPSWATQLDYSGYPRDGAPDIGAFEWR